jgi:polyisoprenoid-binding protein YceI
MNKNFLPQMWSLPIFLGLMANIASADEYRIDPSHSSVTFKIQHLGYSWLFGQFREIKGQFIYEPKNPQANSILVQIDPSSIDTNHVERDKHLRSADFLDVITYPEIKFESTRYLGDSASGVLEGNLTLHGITKPIRLNVKKIGEGRDPWLNYRAGFQGVYTLTRSDFGMKYFLGQHAKTVKIELNIEGIRQ